MKNFSDLLGTNTSLPVMVRIRAHTGNGVPRAWVRVNQDTLYHGQLAEEVTCRTWVNMLEPFDIEVGMSDKVYNEHQETAVEILDIMVGQHRLIPQFDHLSVYTNDHDRDTPGHYLGYNGIWVLDIKQPFYQWLHHAQHQGWLLEPVVFTQQQPG